MTDIAPIKGLIELQDNFTSQLGLAEAALGNFTKQNQESLKAVAGAAGIVGAAIGAIAVATIELGKRGAEVNDVNATLEHFAGGASEAKAAMDALRDGTKNTVDNFVLAKDAAHLLSAGVKLTADDFGTLGQAAFVLQNRGLGDTKAQLELVSDALVTGRTRALSMALGVIDAGDAEENYAKKLGVTKDQLSDAGKVEAKRIQVMELLNAAVKDAGVQNRDFGEEIEFARTQVVNWVDDLGSAIASSKVFTAGFQAIESAVGNAFGGDQTEAINTVVHFLEQGAITVGDFAQVTIDMVRVVEGAWYGVKTIVLSVLQVLVGGIADLSSASVAATKVLEGLHLVPKGATEEVRETSDTIKAMADSLHQQTLEAAQAVLGHTELDKTLDGLSKTIGDVQHAMVVASQSTQDNGKTSETAANNTKKLAETQKELTERMVDSQKVTTALQKSTAELGAIYADYYKEVLKNSGTSAQQQQADIEATFKKQVASLDKLDPLFTEKYTAYRKIADEQLNGIAADWDSVKDKSIEGMQETADKALETWNRMQESGLHFRREVMDEQLQKWRDLQAAARGWGDETKKAIDTTANAVELLDHAWIRDSDVAAQTINKTTIMVKTLAGEVISLQEAQQRQQAGGSFDVTSANFQQSLTSYLTAGGLNPGGLGQQQYRDPYQLAHQGYSFAEIIKYAYQLGYQGGPLPPAQGPRIPGFKDGGVVDIMTGEHGPEVVRVPLGTQVYPSGTMPPGSNGGDTFIFNVNGTAEEAWRKIKTKAMNEVKMRRKFGAA